MLIFDSRPKYFGDRDEKTKSQKVEMFLSAITQIDVEKKSFVGENWTKNGAKLRYYIFIRRETKI